MIINGLNIPPPLANLYLALINSKVNSYPETASERRQSSLASGIVTRRAETPLGGFGRRAVALAKADA